MSSISKLVASKNRLCKLLSRENLTVTQRAGVKTAYIDLKNREVVLPVWTSLTGEEMPAEVLDVLISHEGPGHARHTPQEGWHSALGEYGRAFKSFLNITEDARIEKLVKREFPGIRKSYRIGYKWLVDNEVFGKNIAGRVNTMKFIDRLNCHFKIGVSLNVFFTAEELPFVARMENLETWDETVELAKDLFRLAKETNEDTETETGEGGFGEAPEGEEGEFEEVEAGDGEGNGDVNPGDSAEDDAEEEGDAGSAGDDSDPDDSEDDAEDGDSEDDGETPEDGTSGDEKDIEDGDVEGDENGDDSADEEKEDGADGDIHGDGVSKGSDDEGEDFFNDPNDDDLGSETDDEMHKNLEDMAEDANRFNGNANPTRIVNLPVLNSDEFIVPWKTCLSEMEEFYSSNSMMDGAMTRFQEWKKENSKVVGFLAKEFEMKKAADASKRATVSKTGIINPGALHSYKFSDDIFRRVATVRDGKNHGLIMYVDWSGSMSSNLSDTIDQLLTLVMFCNRVNIPFKVMAFSDNYPGRHNVEHTPNTVMVDNDVWLLEFFNSKMNTKSLTKMMAMLKQLGQAFVRGGYYRSGVPSKYRLGGTPMNSAILLAEDVAEKFQKENNVQVLNTVFLNDGDSSHLRYTASDAASSVNNRYSNDQVIFRDTKTGMEYSTEEGQTKALLTHYKEVTGQEVAGFFIADATPGSFYQVSGKMNKTDDRFNTYNKSVIRSLIKEWKEEGFLLNVNDGYTEQYILPAANLKIQDQKISDFDDGMTKGRLTTMFKKAGKNKVKNRVVLGKFIEMIA